MWIKLRPMSIERHICRRKRLRCIREHIILIQTFLGGTQSIRAGDTKRAANPLSPAQASPAPASPSPVSPASVPKRSLAALLTCRKQCDPRTRRGANHSIHPIALRKGVSTDGNT